MEYALGSLSVTWGENNLVENTTQSFLFKVWCVVCPSARQERHLSRYYYLQFLGTQLAKTLVVACQIKSVEDYNSNIIGDELLLTFGAKFQR